MQINNANVKYDDNEDQLADGGDATNFEMGILGQDDV